MSFDPESDPELDLSSLEKALNIQIISAQKMDQSLFSLLLTIKALNNVILALQRIALTLYDAFYKIVGLIHEFAKGLNAATKLMDVMVDQINKGIFVSLGRIRNNPLINKIPMMVSPSVKGGGENYVADLMGAFEGINWKSVAKPFTAMKKVGKGVFGSMKSLFSSMGPQMLALSLVMEPLMALLNAILEPFELLNPIFEEWGVILSQLLYPIILALLPVFQELTPAFIAIVNALMPLIPLLTSVVGWLVPVANVLSGIIVTLASLVEIVTTAISTLTFVTELIRMMLEFLSNGIGLVLASINSGFQNIVGIVGDYITDMFISPIRDLGQRLRDLILGWFDNLSLGVGEDVRDFATGTWEGIKNFWN